MDTSLEPTVIAEEEEFLIINKPSGLLVHPGPHTGDKEPTLTRWLLKAFPGVRFDEVGDEPLMRPGIVHRLDKPTNHKLCRLSPTGLRVILLIGADNALLDWRYA